MRKIQVPAQKAAELTQGIISLSISYINQTAEVGYGYGDVVDGRFVPIQSTVVYEQIDFAELMEGQPDYAPNKPAGDFKQEDVFAVLDRKKERERAQKGDEDAPKKRGVKK